jgi:hypothetical protein
MLGRAYIKRANWGFAERKPNNFQGLASQHSNSSTFSNAMIIATRNFTFRAYTVKNGRATASNTIITAIASVVGCVIVCSAGQETKHQASHYNSQRGHSFDFTSNLIIS